MATIRASLLSEQAVTVETLHTYTHTTTTAIIVIIIASHLFGLCGPQVFFNVAMWLEFVSLPYQFTMWLLLLLSSFLFFSLSVTFIGLHIFSC